MNLLLQIKVQTLGAGHIGKGHAIDYTRAPCEEVKTLDIIYSD